MRRRLGALVHGEKVVWMNKRGAYAVPIPRPNARERKLLALALEVFELLGREPQGRRMLELQKRLLELYPKATIGVAPTESAWKSAPPTDETPTPSLQQLDWVAAQASKWKEKKQ